MKALKDFLARRSPERSSKGTLGEETDWLPLLEMSLAGKHFLVCDFQFIPSATDGVVIDTTPGTYCVEVKAMDFGGDRRISRVRAFQKKGTQPKVAERIGETWTDTAASAVCDLETLTEEWKTLGEDAAAGKLQEEYEKGEDCRVLQLNSTGAAVPYVASGFGDGTFPVFELCEKSQRVGFEVEFIAPNQPYPFGQPEETPPAAEEKKTGQNTTDSVWAKFGSMLQSLQKETTGHKQADREKLKEAFGKFTQDLENNALSEINTLREHNSQVRRKALPLRITFSRVSAEARIEMPAVKERIKALQDEGFVKVGDFQSSANSKSLLIGFVEPFQRGRASIVIVGEKVALASALHYEDGRVVEFTETSEVAERVRPDWLAVNHRPDLSPSQLIRLSGEHTAGGSLRRTTEANFLALAEEEWFRHVAWSAERGGMSLKELEALVRLSDSPEDVEKLQMIRRDEADKSLCNWLRLQADLPFKVNDVLDTLVIIHDDLTPSLLASAWWCGTNDIRVKDQEFLGDNPRKVLAEMNCKRGSKLRLVWNKRTGLPADYYLPEGS